MAPLAELIGPGLALTGTACPGDGAESFDLGGKQSWIPGPHLETMHDHRLQQ